MLIWNLLHLPYSKVGSREVICKRGSVYTTVCTTSIRVAFYFDGLPLRPFLYSTQESSRLTDELHGPYSNFRELHLQTGILLKANYTTVQSYTFCCCCTIVCEAIVTVCQMCHIFSASRYFAIGCNLPIYQINRLNWPPSKKRLL
jgi:hypothetical protein